MPTEMMPARTRIEPTLAAGFGAVGDAVVCTDRSGRITYLNAAAEALTGWTANEALGRDATDVIRLTDEEMHRTVSGPVPEALRESASRSLLLTARDGSELPISGEATLLP